MRTIDYMKLANRMWDSEILSCIHPFKDGNGRMSRVLTLLPLYQNGYEVGKYMLQVLLACYTDLEARVGLGSNGNRSTVYDVVKAYVTGKVGKFTGAEAIAACSSGSRSAVLGALKRLTDEEVIVKCGNGRGTF